MERLLIVAGIILLSAGAGSAYWLTQGAAPQPEPLVNIDIDSQPIQATVYRTPTCGCCGAWVEHAQAHGFTVQDTVQENLEPIKQRFGITPELASCHTTVANGYVFEGHIPAADIQRFLANPPADVVGLTVPGMPLGSPGMESGDRRQSYDVLALHQDGSTSVFQSYE